jgi:hypothetical protein
LTGAHDQELAGRERGGIILQHHLKVFDLGLQGSSGEPKENYAGVRQSLVENQFSEIPVRDQQDPLLLPRNGENIFIAETGRVVAGNGRNIMAEVPEVVNQPEVGALIKQELHAGAGSGTAPFGGLGETSSPVTIALA